MSFLPQYSTSYGEDFGYNARRGSNNMEFRNRYLNPTYRTPTCRHGIREEFAPRGNAYGPYDGMRKQESRPSTVPAPVSRSPNTVAGSQIVQSQRGPSPVPASQPASSLSQTDYQPRTYKIVDKRPRTPFIRRPGLTSDFKESQGNFGKFSVARRLPERERLRYHVPGYMGFVKNIQFLHGDTYGKTTRKCILQDFQS